MLTAGKTMLRKLATADRHDDQRSVAFGDGAACFSITVCDTTRRFHRNLAVVLTLHLIQTQEDRMKYLIIAATLLATPALADEVGVHVGPVGAGVTVGQSPDYRDRDRDRTTVIKENEPRDRTTVIKKEHDDGSESKTVIHHDND
jgi:hypothetical protein